MIMKLLVNMYKYSILIIQNILNVSIFDFWYYFKKFDK